jgi:hypothetical protein
LQSAYVHRTELIAIAYNDCSACEGRLFDSHDEGLCLSCANADRVRFARSTRVTNVDVAVTASEVHTCAKTDRDIVVPCRIVERNIAEGGIERASEITIKRISTQRRVLMACRVVEAGLNTIGVILIACTVVIQRKQAIACIKIAEGIFEERIVTAGRVAETNR